MTNQIDHISETELVGRLDEAKQKVEIGARYRHSKSGMEVEVLNIGLIEASEKPAVIYRHDDQGIIWIRDVDVFTSMDEIDGQMVPKFVKID